MLATRNNYRSLNDLFNDFFSVPAPANWAKENSWNLPPVNIHESNNVYHLELAAPGLQKEDFKINLEKGLLTISFEKNTESETKDVKVYRKEFTSKSFKRSFTLDENVNAEAIEAKYENGVLKIALPKKEEAKVQPKQIAIQ